MNTEQLTKDLATFKLAVDNANDQVLITDTLGTIIYANQATTAITGFSVAEILGKKAGSKQLWGGLMSKEFYAGLWHTIKTEKKTFRGVIHNKRKDGEEYYASGSISPVLNAQGEVEFFVAIEHDATKEVEIDRAKTEFVSLASHQLRTPLTAMNWYTEMLLAGDAGPLSDDQRKYLKEIQLANERMTALVGALLDVSRIDSGSFVVEPEEVDVVALLQSAVDEQRFIIEHHALRLSLDIGEVVHVQTDPKLLRMVFQNLLSNAIKYSTDGGSVGVSLVQKRAGERFDNVTLPEDAFCFSVSDTGCGIPERQQSKVFSKLFRAENVRSTNVDGTGLGLYVVRSVVNLAGGAVWFVSKEGAGTTFSCWLPTRGMVASAVHSDQ